METRPIQTPVMRLRSVIGAIGVLVVLGWPGLGSAQLELGVFAGVSNYQGDLASYSTTDGLRIKLGPVIGGHAGYAVSPSFALRAQLLYTRLSGDDALAANPESRQRNLDFFAPVGQFVIGMEWSPSSSIRIG